MFSGLAKLTLFGLGLTPTLVALLIAGVLLGKPQPCGTINCVQRPYGGEVLILPFGTLFSMAFGYLIGKTDSSGKPKSRKQEVEQSAVGATNESVL